MNQFLHHNRLALGELWHLIGCLRLLLGLAAVVAIPFLISLFGHQSGGDLRSIALRSIIPSSSVLIAMVLLFDVMMMLLLRSSLSPIQRRVNDGLMVVWGSLIVVLAGLFTGLVMR